MDELEKIINSQFQSQEIIKSSFEIQAVKKDTICLTEEEKKEPPKKGDYADSFSCPDTEDEFIFDSTDTYKACHAKIKKKFTIYRKFKRTGGLTERIAFCKTKECKAKAELMQFS